MPFITFFYIIGKTTYLGKYVFDRISDDHTGLDNEVKNILYYALNNYRKQKNLPRLRTSIKIGILSYSESKYIPLFSSNKEKINFDFYYSKYCNHNEELFINGKKIII